MKPSSNLISRALKLSCAIFINKPIGLLRDILRVRYMGVGLLSDAYSTAWRIPNAFRRIFGEGALSSVLVPTLVHTEKEQGQKGVSDLVTLILIFFQLFITVMCVVIAYKAQAVLMFIAPGALERAAYAVPLLRILIFFILSMSSSVILGSALQARHMFVMGPLSQFFLNIAMCIEYFLCMHYNLSLIALSWMFLANGCIIFYMHWRAYRKYGFTLSWPSRQAWHGAKIFFKRFIPALLGAGMIEVNLFVDQAIASYLPVGSQTMFDYISNFIRLPLQIFGSSFATVSATHFADVAHKSKARLSFHLFEAMKLMCWVCIPAIICVILFSYKALYTVLLSEKFTLIHVEQGAFLMQLFSGYILFSSLNRIMINAYYALHETFLPTLISVVCAITNTFLTYFFMKVFGLPGIVCSTVIVEGLRMLLLFYFLHNSMKITFIWAKWKLFLIRIFLQCLIVGLISYIFYALILYSISFMPQNFNYYLKDTFFYWIWTGPIILLAAFLIYKTRKLYGIKLYYV